MVTNHESIMYTVDKIALAIETKSYFPEEVITRYVFRTRLAARRFAEQRNKGSRKYKYTVPRKAYWGPDK